MHAAGPPARARVVPLTGQQIGQRFTAAAAGIRQRTGKANGG